MRLFKCHCFCLCFYSHDIAGDLASYFEDFINLRIGNCTIPLQKRNRKGVGNQALFVGGHTGITAQQIIETLLDSTNFCLHTEDSTQLCRDTLLSSMSSAIPAGWTGTNPLSCINRKIFEDILVMLAQNLAFDNYAFHSTPPRGPEIDASKEDVRVNMQIIFNYYKLKLSVPNQFPEYVPEYMKFVNFKTLVERARTGIVCSWEKWTSYEPGTKKGLWVHHFYLMQKLFHHVQIQSEDNLVNASECTESQLLEYKKEHDFVHFVFFGGNWEDFLEVDDTDLWLPRITWKGSTIDNAQPITDPLGGDSVPALPQE